MATIGKVAAVFSASTGGLRAGVSDAIRSFRQMGGESQQLAASFGSLQAASDRGVGNIGPASEVASNRLAQFQRLANLAQETLAAGRITAEDFAARMERIGRAADETASAVSRGAAMTERFRTAEESAARTIAEANALLAAGTISHETHARAIREASGAAAGERRQVDAAAAAMRELADTMAEGASVAASVRTADERHADELERLQRLLAAGAISQATYSRAVQRSEQEVRDASSATRSLGTAATSAGSGVERLAGKLNTLIAINASQLFMSVSNAISNAARSVVQFTQREAEAVDQTSKMARRLGLTYGELAGLGLAADLAGVSVESVAQAATRADVAFVKASQGSQLARQALQGIGLSVQQLEGLSPAERFQAIADAISALPTPAERARAAVQLFGRSGAELLPLFEGGAGSISQAAAEAQRFGLALNAVQGQNVENMNDAFTRAFAAVQGVTRQVVAFLAPAIDGIVSSFSNMVGTIGGASIGQRIGEGILAGAESLAVVADGMIAGLGDVWSYAASVASAWRGVWQLGSRMVSFLAGVGNSLKVIFASAIVGLTAPITNLLKGVDFLAKRVGVDIGVENFLRGADAFNESLYQAMQDGGQAAGDNFAAAFSSATPPEVPPPQRGPASTLLADAIAAARAAAAAPAGVEPPQGTQGQTPPQLTASTQAVNAVDSRSSQGLAEMFRLMRGTTDDVQEQQLGVLEQIRDTLSESDPETLVSMAGA